MEQGAEKFPFVRSKTAAIVLQAPFPGLVETRTGTFAGYLGDI